LLDQLLVVPSIAQSLLPESKVVPLTVNQVLYELGDQVDHLYFPLDSVASRLAIMEDGTTIETAMIGKDSVVGISAILGSGRSRQWVWVTIGGNAIQIERKSIERVFVHNEVALKAFLGAYPIVGNSSFTALRLQHAAYDPRTTKLLATDDA
jgi:CRP-like cAMP-binding protein